MSDESTILQLCHAVRFLQAAVNQAIDDSARGPVRLPYEASAGIAATERLRQASLADLKMRGVDTTGGNVVGASTPTTAVKDQD